MPHHLWSERASGVDHCQLDQSDNKGNGISIINQTKILPGPAGLQKERKIQIIISTYFAGVLVSTHLNIFHITAQIAWIYGDLEI
ncbi:hypothetical protein COV93_07470 [Candidatus Woesearchaeota archaeon CG11_big_fil_rev_8_21_14_0_20_43_8]|nr:MAG: hypothetical protein COV93_07470 [Candidatus Woesearchaeota archaeon CG11_big_fil_rev_8_21_14_0_20_43_8]